MGKEERAGEKWTGHRRSPRVHGKEGVSLCRRFKKAGLSLGAPAHENYTLVETGSGTRLIVDVEVPAEYREFFEDRWSEALKAIKELAEKPETS